MSTRDPDNVDPADVEILHLGEIETLFKEHMKCGETYYRKNYRPLVESLLFPKGRRPTKKTMVARKKDVMRLITEIKTKGWDESFKDG